MKILFTGGSSFSGYWFIQALAKAGHEVTATFRGNLESYSGLRRQRVDLLLPLCQPVFNSEFGSENFLQLIDGQKWDLLCHHAADVTNYKSPDFNVIAAVDNNTKNLPLVLQKLTKSHCKKVLLTGSIFEKNEGMGSDDLRAFSPYGLSKGLTAELFRYHTQTMDMKLGKFVIPNPFGMYEEPRFTSYLMQNWAQGKTATVNTPLYERDNIPVTLLAKAYVNFAENLTSAPGFEKINPSFYAESQGAFTERFAREMRPRLNLVCKFELGDQRLFPEPKVRLNTDSLKNLKWDEKHFWDDLAAYYKKVLGCRV